VIKRFSVVVALVGAALALGGTPAHADVTVDSVCVSGNATADAACRALTIQGWHLTGAI
jgi:hypothetical protein